MVENKNQFEVGDVVIDVTTNHYAIVIRKEVTWIDTDDQEHKWDYEIMTHNRTSFADEDDLLKIWTTKS